MVIEKCNCTWLLRPTGNIDAIRKRNDNHNFLKLKDQSHEPRDCQAAPRLTDLLLWLQFLPYCSKYSEVISTVKEQIKGTNGNNDNFVTHLKESISHLPMLFLQIEGPGKRNGSSPVHGSSLFLKISELSKCQYISDQKYYDKDNVVKMLLCVFPVIHWGLKALKERCTNGSCGITLKQCTETRTLLTSLGWNGTEGKPSVSGNMNCKTFRDYLTNYFLGNSSPMAKMKKILEEVWKDPNGQNVSTASGSHLPRTIYEMLVWLMGLPVSESFKELKTQGGVSTVMQQFTEILFQLPHLFLTLNGDLSGLLGDMYKFQGIGASSGGTTFTYGESGEACFKIFSAIVAILFPVIRYLQQRCNRNGQAFANGESWKETNINADGLKTYLNFAGFQPISSSGMNGQAFHTTVLQPIFGDVTGANGGKDEKLNKLYDCAVKGIQNNSVSSSSGSHTPTTIRQMMLWLIGLPLTDAYKGSGTNSLVGTGSSVLTGIEQNKDLKDLEQKSEQRRLKTSTAAATGKHFKQQLKGSIVGMIMLFQRIEGGLGSVLEFLKGGFKDGGAKEKFKYEGFNDNKTILDVLGSYVYKVHTQLRFLKVMCKTGKNDGGWEMCIYSNKHFATGSGIKCNCSDKLTIPCNNSPLRHFLNSTSGKNRFLHGSELAEMGFKNTVSTDTYVLTGSTIYTYLKDLLDPIPTTTAAAPSPPTPKPLSLLTQYCVAIGNMEPSSLGDHIDVFRELAGDMWSKIQEKVKTEIKSITQGDNDGQGASGKLQQALKAVMPGTHNGGTHPSDLRSLTGCHEGACTPYIASLSYGLYNFFDPTKLGSPANKIDWLYMKMSSLYGKLEKLNKTMKVTCDCCMADKTALCKGIIKCPSCLPQLYKVGLFFGDAEKLVGKGGVGPKNCIALRQVIEKVLQRTSTLMLLFTKIDETRFKPYLLFSAMVVQGKYGQLTVTGDENYNCYTKALGSYYEDTYLKKVKKELEQTAQDNKKTRENALKCACNSEHTYTAPAQGSGSATVVTLTLYFHKDGVTVLQLVVPHHYPLYNPLVRLYPRNLKSIVDWLLRIGQTRLEQKASVASTKDTGLKEMCKTLWPTIEKCVKDMDQQENFKQLVTNVMKLMGLENKGKQEVNKDVDGKLKDVKDKIQEKLNGDNGKEKGFQETFQSILKFSPKQYIDKVIEDFGKQLCNVTVGSEKKDRSFNCVAKAVSKCMKDSLEKIKDLATQNKELETKYGISGIPEPNGSITDVENLKDISTLQTLCDGFKDFHEAYKTVTGAFNSHLNTAQKNGGKDHWDKVNKCVDAFNELGECAEKIGALNSMSTADKMGQASMKLEKISDKLQDVHTKLNDNGLNGIEALSQEVDGLIKKLDTALEGDGKTKLETALEIYNSKTTSFDTFLQSYVSELITKMKKNNNDKNTSCDIHLRVRNDLLQLSECLKVMCEVCGTGMKDFAHTLKECVLAAREKMKDIDKVKTKLEKLKTKLTSIMDGSKHSEMTNDMRKSIKYIHSLLKNPYIFNPPPLVSEQIDAQDVSTMTHYLKSLPNLIRDRYVLQKWKDSPEDFCGVQSFNNGIVKETDNGCITGVLQDLLKEEFHQSPTSDVTIHTFQVKSLIYNFCHKEGIEQIGAGLEAMESVKKVLENGNVDWSSITSKKQELLPLLTSLSENAYLRYFATHLRDSIGYHTLSNTLGALEKVKESLTNGSQEQPEQWDKIQELLKKNAIEDLYNRLSSLLDKLNREYIFEYPPFDWQKSCHRLVEQNKTRVTRSTDASAPSTPTTCDLCVADMAQIFVGFVPQMYRLFKMLREMTTKDGSEHTLELTNNGRDAKTTTMSSLAGMLSREGWRVKLGSGTSSGGDQGYDLNDALKGDTVYEKLKEIIGEISTGVLVAQGEASTTDSLKPLDKLFKAVMQHFRKERDAKKTQREEKLKQEFNKDPNNKGIPFQAPPAPLPSTVRQVLFWLHEMDTNKAFYDGMSQHINTLCQQSSIRISHDNILHVLNLSITQCLEVLSTVEDPGRQNAQYYYELYTEEHYYAYPDANIPLFFYTFVEKLMGAFLELNFVCVQCDFGALEGGWKDCRFYGEDTVPSRYKRGVKCECIPSFVEYTCSKPLSAFLFSDQKNQLRIPGDVSQRLPYMSKGTMPCGFQLKNKAITDAATQGDAQSAPTPTPTSMTGSVLVEPLQKLVGGHVKGRLKDTSTRNDDNNTLSTVIYLRDLLRYTLCLAVRPPWSMSENMAFFYRVTESWKKQGGVSVAHHNAKLLGAIHAEIALFPGTFDGKLLTTAVERFAGVEEKEHDKTKATHSNMSHQYDLKTLMGCKETNTSGTSAATGPTILCSPFMFPLSLDVYTHYDHKNSRAYLSWILNFAFGIYGQLRGLEEIIKERNCMRNASKSTSQCPSLPMCPGVLTALYQSGSSFMDQRQLAKENTSTVSATTTKKTCAHFRDVLSGLFNCRTATDPNGCTPLHNLIVQCEAFLWSIRLPFSLVQLSLWSVAILFISYVFVVPLDHFKIKSHLFNRLKYTMHPGLLIADQQRRVSEVAYFSL